jgi:peptide-methionine (S)-S-oxide reductase
VKTSILLLLTLAMTATISTAAETKAASGAASPSGAPAGDAERITFGGGCFWCIEAVFQRLEGVKKVVSGYAGGHVPNPTYKQVTQGDTGHAEVVQIEYDPAKTSYAKMLEVFWAAHDPTTPNRQGHDVGPQYRSIILYENDAQRAEAEKSKQAAAKDFKNPIVTEIVPLKTFYVGEGYHQNYYNQNKDQNPYCSAVITPKLKQLLKKGIIKEETVVK